MWGSTGELTAVSSIIHTGLLRGTDSFMLPHKCFRKISLIVCAHSSQNDPWVKQNVCFKKTGYACPFRVSNKKKKDL